MSVYLRAAELMDADNGSIEFSCIAIDRTVGLRRCRESCNYARFFNPREGAFDGDAWGMRWGKSDTNRKNCRVLALLFMHWISEGEK